MTKIRNISKSVYVLSYKEDGIIPKTFFYRSSKNAIKEYEAKKADNKVKDISLKEYLISRVINRINPTDSFLNESDLKKCGLQLEASYAYFSIAGDPANAANGVWLKQFTTYATDWKIDSLSEIISNSLEGTIATDAVIRNVKRYAYSNTASINTFGGTTTASHSNYAATNSSSSNNISRHSRYY